MEHAPAQCQICTDNLKQSVLDNIMDGNPLQTKASSLQRWFLSRQYRSNRLCRFWSSNREARHAKTSQQPSNASGNIFWYWRKCFQKALADWRGYQQKVEKIKKFDKYCSYFIKKILLILSFCPKNTNLQYPDKIIHKSTIFCE